MLLRILSSCFPLQTFAYWFVILVDVSWFFSCLDFAPFFLPSFLLLLPSLSFSAVMFRFHPPLFTCSGPGPEFTQTLSPGRHPQKQLEDTNTSKQVLMLLCLLCHCIFGLLFGRCPSVSGTMCMEDEDGSAACPLCARGFVWARSWGILRKHVHKQSPIISQKDSFPHFLSDSIQPQ